MWYDAIIGQYTGNTVKLIIYKYCDTILCFKMAQNDLSLSTVVLNH